MSAEVIFSDPRQGSVTTPVDETLELRRESGLYSLWEGGMAMINEASPGDMYSYHMLLQRVRRMLPKPAIGIIGGGISTIIRGLEPLQPASVIKDVYEKEFLVIDFNTGEDAPWQNAASQWNWIEGDYKTTLIGSLSTYDLLIYDIDDPLSQQEEDDLMANHVNLNGWLVIYRGENKRFRFERKTA